MERYYITATLGRSASQTEMLPPVPSAQVHSGRIKAVVKADTWQEAMEIGKRLINGCLKKGVRAYDFGWIAVKDAMKIGDDQIYQAYQTATPLNYYRAQAGLTQMQLSAASSVNIRQIQRVELGESDAGNITARNLIALADALGVDPRDLFV